MFRGALEGVSGGFAFILGVSLVLPPEDMVWHYGFLLVADSRAVSNAPDLFQPPKLSSAGPGQYWGGGLPRPGRPSGAVSF